MNIRAVIGVLVLVILALIIGLVLGSSLGSKKATVPDSQTTTQSTSDLVKVLSSKVVPSITAKGMVTKISGDTIAVTYQNDTRSIKMASDATVSQLVLAANKTSYNSNQLALKDIAVGQNVQVSVRVLATGQLEGFSVIVLPAPVVVSPTSTTKK